MNRIRRLAALLLTLSFLMSMLPTATIAASPSFGDTDGHWAEDAVARWAEYGVLTGGEDGNFAPDRQITRGEMAKIVAVMLGYETQAENSFTDLDESAWYAPYILMCLHMGVMTGDGAGHVRPSDPITRQEACKMLVVALGLTPEVGAADFSDSAEIADWAAPYVGALRKAGYIQGVGDGSFAPAAPITRASAVTILDNAVAGYITQPGVYSETYEGIVIVTCGGVTFKDAKVEGNLIAAQGLGKGDVTLENTTVTGTVVAPEGTVTEPAPQPTPTPKPNNGGGSYTPPDPTPQPPPTGVVRLNWNTYAMACGRSNGEGETLTLSVDYDKSAYSNAEVRWETTDPEIVALKAATGDSVTVQSRTTGFADVTATLYDGETAIGFDVCKISAIDGYDRATMQTLELTASELTLAKNGGPVTLIPVFYPVEMAGDGKMDTSLEIVDGHDTGVITVSLKADQNYADYADIGPLANDSIRVLYDQVVVTPVGAGTTTFTVKSTVNDRIATCKVTVTEEALAVTGLTGGSSETIELTVGGDKSTQQLTVAPEGGETDIIWTSSNPYIATVDENGLVTARSTSNYEERRENSSNPATEGEDDLFKTVTITATSVQGGYSQTFKVLVKPQTIKATGISLNKEAVNVAVGGQDTFLYANVNPAAILAPNVTWTSADETVLTVEEAGYTVFGASQVKLKPVAAGTTTVTAAYAGYEATCQVTVTTEVVKIDTIAIQGPSTLVRDQVAALTATVTADATNQKVFWLSTDRTKVTVDQEGNIQGYDAGDATIYAIALDTLTEDQEKVLFFTADLNKLADNQAPGNELNEIRNISEDDEAKAKLEALLAADNVVSASYTVTVDGSASKYLRNLHIPEESVTYESVALLWNRDSGYYTSDLEKTEVKAGGKLVATLGNEMSYTVKGLAANTTYTFQVTTYYGGGQTVSQTVNQRTAPAPTRVLNVMEAPYNAVGDGSTMDTYAIQSAIDDCPAGGEVVLPAGHIFYSGALFLKSDMTFRVDGILMGSTDPKDYPRIVSRWEGWRKIYQPAAQWANENEKTGLEYPGIDNEYVYSSLLTVGVYDEGEDGFTAAYNTKNVTICGTGQVNANGYQLSYSQGPNSAVNKPSSPFDYSLLRQNQTLRGHVLVTHNVQGLYVADVMLANGPAWTLDLIYGRDMTLDNARIVALSNYKTTVGDSRNYILNGDGCDVDSSTHTNILNSFFRAGDDAIAAKSGKNREGWMRGKPTAYLRVTDVFSLGSRYGLIIGSEMAGGAHDCLFQNNEFKDNASNESMWIKAPRERGGLVEDIVHRDIFHNDRNHAAIKVEADYSDNYKQTPAPINTRIRRLTYENISETSSKESNFKGKDNSLIRDVLILGSQLGAKPKLSYVDGFTMIDTTPNGTSGSTGVSKVVIINNEVLKDVNVKLTSGAKDVKEIDLAAATISVRKGTTVEQFLAQIQPDKANLGDQQYAVTDAVGEMKAGEMILVSGDKLTITAKNGHDQKIYSVGFYGADEIGGSTDIELIPGGCVEGIDSAASPKTISVIAGSAAEDMLDDFRSILGGELTCGLYVNQDDAGEKINQMNGRAVLADGNCLRVDAEDKTQTAYYQVKIIIPKVVFSLVDIYDENPGNVRYGNTDPNKTTTLPGGHSIKTTDNSFWYFQVLSIDQVGDYFECDVSVQATASYRATMRAKTDKSRGIFQVMLIPKDGGNTIDLGEVSQKSGKDNLTIGSGEYFTVPAGDYTLRIICTTIGHFTAADVTLTPVDSTDTVEAELEIPFEEPGLSEDMPVPPQDESETPVEPPEQPEEESDQAKSDPQQPAEELERPVGESPEVKE